MDHHWVPYYGADFEDEWICTRCCVVTADRDKTDADLDCLDV